MTKRSTTKKLSRFFLGAIMAALICPQPAEAIDFKVKGSWQMLFEMGNWMPRGKTNQFKNGNDTFAAWQLFRTTIEAVASENLSGTVQFEIGDQNWGTASEGGALGADGNEVEVRHAYIDWMIPKTDVKVRMGIQPLSLPGIISQWGLGALFGHDMAGVTVSSPIYQSNDLNISGTFFWARPYNDNSQTYKNVDLSEKSTTHLDNLDVFALSLPIRSTNWTFNPYFMYANIGQYSLSNLQTENESALVVPRGGLTPMLGGGYAAKMTASRLSQLNPWGSGFWAGGFFTYNITSALKVGIEGAYGAVDMGQIKNYSFYDGGKSDTLDMKRAGWYIGGRVDYKTDNWGTPGLIAWYGPGDDDDPHNGSERLPNFNTPWGVTNLAFGGTAAQTSWKVLGHNPSGLAAVVAQVADIPSFIEGMSHTVRAGYYWGTNSADMPKKANITLYRLDGPHSYMTTMDTAWELNFNTKYKIYDNFNVVLECAYVRLNLDEDTWDHNNNDVTDYMNKDNWKFDMVFTYNF